MPTNLKEKERILEKIKRNLAILKRQEVEYAGNAPLGLINEIDDFEAAVVLTEQVIRDEITEAEWQKKLQSVFISMGFSLSSRQGEVSQQNPPGIKNSERQLNSETEKVRRDTTNRSQELHREIEDSFRFVIEEWKKLYEELKYLAPEPRNGAIYLLNQAKGRLVQYEKEWQNLKPNKTEAVIPQLEKLDKKIGYEESLTLAILKRRVIHRKNLTLLEQQLAAKEVVLPRKTLQEQLRPAVEDLVSKVKELQKKAKLTPEEEHSLKTYQGDLKIYQQMWDGVRPFAPLSLLKQIAGEKEKLAEIDKELMNAEGLDIVTQLDKNKPLIRRI
jgi:hypothetical protein